MDRLNAIEAFVRVVELGGFTAAAASLRKSRAMVSKHVLDLEERLGARLLHRTTRRIGLTEIGRIYYERCVQLLDDLAEADAAVTAQQSSPRGTLRLNAPMSFGTMHLAAAVADFSALHPEVSVDMALNDRIVDLVEEGYDVAVRIGRLADSTLIARRLAPCRMAVCAAPAYLARHGEPATPADLSGHNCLSYTLMAQRDEWRFEGSEGAVSVRVSGSLNSNNGEALAAAARRGLGIIVQPTFIVGEDLKAGRLVRLLADYRHYEPAISAVYPHARHLSAKVRSFVDFLAGRFGDRPQWDAWLDGPKR
jgi:DNA-binding transcriptional LysR family regulator